MKDMSMCSCLVLYYLCYFVYYPVEYLGHVRVLTHWVHVTLCLLFHAGMIHVAAHSEIDVLFTPCALCNLLSNILNLLDASLCRV